MAYYYGGHFIESLTWSDCLESQAATGINLVYLSSAVA